VKIDIQMKELSKAIKDIEVFALSKKEEIKKVVAESAVTIEGDAITNTPVGETGNLKGGWNVTFYQDGLSADISNPVFYAPYVEYGTLKMKARPILFSAFERERPNYTNHIKKALKG
jgi:HK97 gp10 family phage protein